VNDPRLPVRFGSLLLRCPEAPSNIDLGRNQTSKVFNSRATLSTNRTDRVSAPSNGFEPPFMTSIGSTIAVHDRR
jgi:hypothetical protein